MDMLTFDEQLNILREAVESPSETLVAIERTELFTKLFKHLYKTLAPDDADVAETYREFVDQFLTEWLEG